MLTGWAMLAAYLTTAMALTVATSIFIKTMLTGLGMTFVPPTLALYALVSVLIWLLSARDMRISSRIGLSLEAVSMAIILFVCISVLMQYGFHVDAKQVSMEGLDFKAIPQAIVFAIFAFVGFESAATLGKETRDPTTTIPKAINWTAVSAGLFFIFTSYVIMMGFDDDATKLAASSAPLADILSGKSPLLTAFVYFGAAISSFACALASLNAFGRMLFSMGRYQFVHKSMGMVHGSHKTPHVALAVGAVINFVVCAALSGAVRDRHVWLVRHDGVLWLHRRLSDVLDLRARLSEETRPCDGEGLVLRRARRGADGRLGDRQPLSDPGLSDEPAALYLPGLYGRGRDLVLHLEIPRPADPARHRKGHGGQRRLIF